MAQNEVPVDFVILVYIIAVNLDQLWEIFRCFRGYKPSREAKTPLEAVTNYLEAILKVSRQTRGIEQR